METATKAPKKKKKKNVFTLNLCHVPLMERWWKKSWQTPAANYVGTHFSVLVAFIFSHVQKKRKKKNMFSLHISLFHITSLSLVRLKQHLCCYLLLCTLHFVCECAVVFCPHRAAQLSPQSSTLVPGCSSEQVWWWRPRPAWGPAPRRRCWETARTHGSGTLWSSASNGSWEEW